MGFNTGVLILNDRLHDIEQLKYEAKLLGYKLMKVKD